MREMGTVGVRVILGTMALAAVLMSGGPGPAMAQTPAAGAPAVTGAPPTAEDETLTVRRRAAGFWQAKIARDFAAQYRYLEPREQGRTSPEELAGDPGALEYLGYQVEDAVIAESFATVRVRVLVQPNHPMLRGRKIGPQAMVLSDQWVRVSGTWYRVARPETQLPGSLGAGATPSP